jgi:hypothetical protein
VNDAAAGKVLHAAGLVPASVREPAVRVPRPMRDYRIRDC